MDTGEVPRFVYHGTTADIVDDVLESGLIPSDGADRENWGEMDFPSIPGHVYLTRYYPLFFAAAAADETKERITIIEIDLSLLDAESLYPDEDFVEQVTRGTEHEEMSHDDLIDRTATVRSNIENYREYWNDSLAVLGNCSYKGTVPVECIRRVSVVTMTSRFHSFVSDTTITNKAAPVMGPKYELLTKHLLGDDVSEEVENVPVVAAVKDAVGESDLERVMADVAPDSVIWNESYVG